MLPPRIGATVDALLQVLLLVEQALDIALPFRAIFAKYQVKIFLLAAGDRRVDETSEVIFGKGHGSFEGVRRS